MQLSQAMQKAVDELGHLPGPGVWNMGSHVMIVGDLEEQAVLDELIALGPWDVCWTDPPWRAGSAAIFRKQADAPGAPDVEKLYSNLGEVLGWVRDCALVWTNEETKPLAVGALYQGGFVRSCEFKVTYNRFMHPTLCTVAGREHVDLDGLDLNGLRGGRAIAEAYLEWYRSWQPKKPIRLVDPFAGQDVAAHIASKWVHLTGAEIHPGRVAVSLAKLAKRG